MFRSHSLKISGLVFAVALLMACSLTNVSPTPISTLAFSTITPQALTDAQSPAATPTLPATNTPLPPTALPATSTTVPSPIPTTRPPNPTLLFDSAANAYRIEFGAGGTWAQFSGNLDDSNQTVRYVLSAMKGQEMGLSIIESWPFFMDVTYAGDVIGNAEQEHPFWRGTLPATGDYIITVKTQMPGDFTLRVTINPPNQTHQYFNENHQQPPFKLRYSDEFSPTTYIPVGEFKGAPGLILNFINSDFYGPHTNLVRANFLVNTVNNLASCTQVNNPGETLLGEKTFNGYTFTESQFTGVGAGNIYEQLFYRTLLDNTCYEIVFFMHSGNIGNYPSGTVVEFNRAALLQKFEEVLATFTIN